MKNQETSAKTSGISTSAVQAKTRKSWQQWFAILDAAGAMEMSHTDIARNLRENQNVPAWWSQMVANAYEQARGLRQKHQVPAGYQISVSKTVNASIAALYECWSDQGIRSRWLTGESISIRKASPHKSMRITWTDALTNVEVNFYDRGESKGQVVVQHGKLADSIQAERMKSYWREALERLSQVV